MSAALERLGRLCVRRRITVLVCCVLAVVGLAIAAGALGTRTSDNVSLPGTGTQRA